MSPTSPRRCGAMRAVSVPACALAAGAALALAAALCFARLVATTTVGVVRVAGDLDAAQRQQVEATVGRELAKRPPGDAGAVASAVGALGWVREARVRRQWPDALLVQVARETLTARWRGGWLTASGGFVADSRGFVADSRGFVADSRRHLPPPNVPTFATVQADGPEAMRVFEVVNAAASTGGLAVAGLEEDANGWTAVLDGGLRLVVGREDLAARTLRFVHVYRQALRYAGPIALADARYDRGVAVRWRPATGTPSRSANLLAAAAPGAPAGAHGRRD